MSMATDTESTFKDSCMSMVGFDMSRRAAEDVYRQAGLTAQDAQVVELHDCFSANELITYEALKLCGPGEAGNLVSQGQTTYGGRWVVNPSGGLISKVFLPVQDLIHRRIYVYSTSGSSTGCNRISSVF